MLIVLTYLHQQPGSKEANGRNCTVFHTSAKFGVLKPALMKCQRNLAILRRLQGEGGLDFCLRFPYKVKIVKRKCSSWSKLFTPHKRASKAEKNDSPYDTSVMRYNRSKMETKLVRHAQYTKSLFEYELQASIIPFPRNVKVLCNSSFCFIQCVFYFCVFNSAYTR